MHDRSNPLFETTDTGCHVAGTGLPRLEAAARSGARSRRGSLLDGWGWDMIRQRPRQRPRVGDSRGPR
ncbi:unnamed protein product [Ectocarpus sp. CCAP 1310/34]|nr:unnamed protein product [Ectocarpus sp. CCAP 1310/34]